MSQSMGKTLVTSSWPETLNAKESGIALFNMESLLCKLYMGIINFPLLTLIKKFRN